MEAVDSCKRSRTHRKSRIKYQRAREPHKYARTSKPWIHRGVARTKAATVQTTSNRERTSASKSRVADLIAYARILFGGANDPTRPSEHERYGWGEGTPNPTQKPKTWSKETHALSGGSESSRRSTQHESRYSTARPSHTQALILKRRVDVVSYHKIYLFKNYHF